MMSTLFASSILGFLFYSSFGANNLMSAPIGMMFTSGCITSAAFIQCAFDYNKEKEDCCEQSTDGSPCCDKTLSKEENVKATGCC